MASDSAGVVTVREMLAVPLRPLYRISLAASGGVGRGGQVFGWCRRPRGKGPVIVERFLGVIATMKARSRIAQRGHRASAYKPACPSRPRSVPPKVRYAAAG